MGRFTSPAGVTFSVDDSKDERYGEDAGYEPAAEDAPKAPAKKAASSKSEK